jgi:hypothetical protein
MILTENDSVVLACITEDEKSMLTNPFIMGDDGKPIFLDDPVIFTDCKFG